MLNERINGRYYNVLKHAKEGRNEEAIDLLECWLEQKQTLNGFRLLAELYELDLNMDKAEEAYVSALALAIENEDSEQAEEIKTILDTFYYFTTDAAHAHDYSRLAPLEGLSGADLGVMPFAQDVKFSSISEAWHE